MEEPLVAIVAAMEEVMEPVVTVEVAMVDEVVSVEDLVDEAASEVAS